MRRAPLKEGEMRVVKAVRCTVDMIAVFRCGEMPEPVRFRYTDREGKETIINVDRILDLAVDRAGSGNSITYTCLSIVGRRQIRYDLKYVGRDIRWELYKIGDM